MKLGVLTALFADQPLEKALDFIKNAGLDAIELVQGILPQHRIAIRIFCSIMIRNLTNLRKL